MTYLPMTRLAQTAKMRPAQALADETHQSWPVPVLGADGLRAVFLYAPFKLEPGKGQLLSAPTYVAQIDATTGQFLEMHLVKPADLGQSDEPGATLGYYALPEGITAAQYESLEADAMRLLDALVQWFADDATRLDPRLAQAARELRRIYWALTAPPLHRYYRALGRRFFAWLDTVAGE